MHRKVALRGRRSLAARRPRGRIAEATDLAEPQLRQPHAGAIIRCNRRSLMRNFSAVIERDPDTGLYVGFVPGFPGAHSQGATLDELNANLREVIAMLLEDGDPVLESEFIGVQNVAVA
jgi:predicted RNase H-like HicB family nuclease